MYQNEFSFARLFRAYGRAFQFRGRSTRTELLGYWVSVWLLSTVGNWIMIAMSFGRDDGGSPFAASPILNLLLLIPAPALAVRRSHDIGRPGFWASLLIVPAAANLVFGKLLAPYPVLGVAMSITYFVGLVLLFWTPEEGENDYGPDPRLVDDRWIEES